MDLGTMWKKMEDGRYPTQASMQADFELMVANCHQFNPPASLPVVFVDKLMARWNAEWSRSFAAGPASDKMSAGEKRGLQSVLKQLTKDDLYACFVYDKQSSHIFCSALGGIFQLPVDPIALGIPQYFDVIPRETARDLRTIKSKLDSDAYKTVTDFIEDLDLMVNNALKFNAPGTPVHDYALNCTSSFC
jgi:transcription initiation factor TFIID subunit 2